MASCGKDNPSDTFTSESEWSIIGTIGGDSWTKDIAMKTDGTWHAAFGVTITDKDEFKFRRNGSWDTNLGGLSSAKANKGEKVDLAQGGDNLKIAAGTYDIYLAPENSIAYFLGKGAAFTHAAEGEVVKGAELKGEYSASLDPSSKLSGITYQLNVYSFADSDGDGWGDFQGIIDHLDYLDALGATALWLSPVNASQSYHAYDIKDYFSINPIYGGKGASAKKAETKLKELIDAAAAKGIDIYIDYVLNHSGDKNPWFTDACAGNAPYKDYYVISDNYSKDVADGKIDNFAGQTDPHMGSWHGISGTKKSYFASFDRSMPDLNYGPWTTCETSPAFVELAASADKWIQLGVNGLRLDAVMWIYQCNTEANVKFLYEWYNHCNATYKARGGKGNIYMVGEAYDWNADVVAPYYQGLPSLFDFPYYGTVKDRISRGRGSDLGATIKGIQDKNKKEYASRKHTHSEGFQDAIKLSNHDENRIASELGNHDQKKRLAGAILLTSPGKPFIYQGEELGYWGVKNSGDQNVRQPVYWAKGESVPRSWSGFDMSVISDGMSVSEQSADDRSILQLYRHFAYARNTHPALAQGEIVPMSSGNSAVAAWKMKSSKETVLVMHNLSGGEVTVSTSETPGNVIVSSANGEIKVNGTSVTLPAYSSVVFAL